MSQNTMMIGVVVLLMCSSVLAGGLFIMNNDENSTLGPGPSGPGPSASTQLSDGVVHLYDSTKTYVCTSGKEIGCANEDNNMLSGTGVYENDACPNSSKYVYCMNPKTVTMAEYSDNEPIGTGSLDETMHRYTATGKRCPTPENANCQDDKSIVDPDGGDSQKITSMVTSRQCVDDSILYC